MGVREVQLLSVLSYLYLANGEEAKALTLLRLLEKRNPQDISVLRLLVYAYLANNHGDEALRVIDRLLELDQSSASPAYHLLRSKALYRQSRHREACSEFEQFISMRSQGGKS